MIHARNCRYFTDWTTGESFRVILRPLARAGGPGAYRHLQTAVFETINGDPVGSVLPIRGADFPWLTRDEFARLLVQAVERHRCERPRSS
jgi:hypothetical protein